MPKLTIGLKEAKVFTPVEDGAYPARIQAVSDVIKGPKAPYIEVNFVITEGGHEGRDFDNRYPVDGAGAGMFISFLNTVTGSDIDVEEYREQGIEIDTDDLLGIECGIVMKQEEFPAGSGQMRSNIQYVLPA